MGNLSRGALLGAATLTVGLTTTASCSSLSGLSGGADAQPDGIIASDGGGPEAAADARAAGPETSLLDGGPQVDAPIPPGDGAGGCGGDPCTLAVNLNHPFAMTSDDANVYWVEFGTDVGTQDGAVKSCPVSGCGAGPLVYASALVNPRGLVVDGARIYFGTAGFGAASGAIWSCPLTGCAGGPTMLAAAGMPFGMAIDSTNLYWVDNGDNTVHRVAKSGGADTVLYDGSGTIIVEPWGCAVDTAYVYLSDSNSDVGRVPIAGGALEILAAPGYGGPCPLQIDQSNVYYGISGLAVIMKASKTATDGGSPIAMGIADPSGLALDPGGVLYFANWGTSTANDGTIGKLNVDGTGLTNLSTSLATPEAVTINSRYLFWLSNGTLISGTSSTMPGTGTLMRGPK